MSPRSTRIVKRSTAVRRLKRFVRFSVWSAMSGIDSVTISKAHFHQQRPVVHAAHRCVTQNLDASDLRALLWTKNIIDTAIVDRGVAGGTAEIAKVAQNVAVRFAVVFQVVSIKIALVRSFELEVEIAGHENFRRQRLRLGPVDHCFGVAPATRSVESIGMSTQQ